MAEPADIALIHAEIDGELSDHQRAELARHVLADPKFRALREDLRRVCTALESVEAVEPPEELHAAILAALPQSMPTVARHRWGDARWRYAALIAGALATGALVFAVVDGQGPATTEASGTLTGPRPATIMDAVQLPDGAVRGRVRLTREGSELGLAFELVASAPVDVLVEAEGRRLKIESVGGAPQTVSLPGFRTTGPAVNLTFLIAGEEVGRATLRTAAGR